MRKSSVRLTDGISLCVALQILIGVAGCISGNKAEINAVKIERKPTAAEEANKWADFAGKIFKPITDRK